MASLTFNVVKNNLEGVAYRGDLNNVTTGGVYTVTMGDVTNYPYSATTGSMGNLIVIHTLYLTHQILLIGNTVVYMRRYIPGYNWSAWAQTTLTPET